MSQTSLGRSREWAALNAELDRWPRSSARFWWRDDDAHAPSPALDRLLVISEEHAAPLHLAVIPSLTGRALARRLQGCKTAFVVQHGLRHRNHEPTGKGASEIGVHRPLEAQLSDLRTGWRLLRDAQLPNLLPVLAPPWNRIADKTAMRLPGLGYRCLTTFSPGRSGRRVPGLGRIDCHLDPINWRSGQRFRGEARLLKGLVRQLEARRVGADDAEDPIGLLTHHLQSDEPTWEFVEKLARHLSRHPAVTWVSLSDWLDKGEA